MLVRPAHAQIVNKAIPNLPRNGGEAFAKYLAIIWWTIVIVGGLATLFYLAWGALDMIFSGSNQDRFKRAKEKFSNAIFGLMALALSYAIIRLISQITGLDILNPNWPTL